MSSQQSSSSSQASVEAPASAREARRRAGERIGQWIRQKYRLERLLGVGGMASVFAATHRNGSQVALKILHTEFAREEPIKQRFLREGYVANKVDHPGRVAILDDDQTEQGEPFLVLELLEGETLQQLWKRHGRKVPVLDALVVAEAVLDTLVPFHEQNIIHRDLKPANIFITNEGVVKLLDFGVAQLREQGGEALTRAGTALGTPSFMSPEQAMGKSDQLDGRADIFSVGATLYAILSGRRLHQGKSDNEAFILAATQPAPSLARVAPETPVEVIALVDRALSWDRRKRFADAAEMREACRALVSKLRDDPVASERPSVLPGRLSVPPTRVASPGAMRPPPAASAPLHPPAPSAGEATPGPPAMSGARARTRSSLPPTPGPRTRSSAPPSAQRDNSLAEVFVRLEKAFPTLRHYGLDHPEARQKVRAVHRALLDALRDDPDSVRFDVHPFCFTRDGSTVWEPEPPLDQLPYNLASAGVEHVHFKPGLSDEELSAFLRAVVVEPQLQGEEGDIGAELWEAGLEHILCRIRDDFAEADARAQMQFFDEADAVEAGLRGELGDVAELLATTADPRLERADKAEAAAVALSTDKASLRALRESSHALLLEHATRAALGAQLSLPDDEWADRFVDVAAVAYQDTLERGDQELVLTTVRRHAAELALGGAWSELAELYDRWVERVAQRDEGAVALTRAAFGWSVVERAFERAREEPTSKDAAVVVALLERVLGALDGSLVEPMLGLAGTLDGELQELALRYLEAAVPGREEIVIERLDALPPRLAERMLAVVAASAGPGANEQLNALLMSSNPTVRCEATALLAPSQEQLGKQLLRMLESSDAALRAAALATMLRHQVRSAGPALVQWIEAPSFGHRSSDEQRLALETLYAFNAPRAERLLMTIVDQHGMLADEALDRLRALAADVLGAQADSAEPLGVLENAARRRPWNTQALRSAASAAIAALRARIGAPAHEVEP